MLEKEKKELTTEERPPTIREPEDIKMIIHSTERVALAEVKKLPRVAMVKVTGVISEMKLLDNSMLLTLTSLLLKVLLLRKAKNQRKVLRELPLKNQKQYPQ